MKPIVDYVDSGKPIVGLRTATHAFHFKKHKTYQHYDFRSKEWKDGFGRQVLGETWVSHHGGHGTESTRGIIAGKATSHPIIRGIKNGDIWDPSDVYTVRLPMMDGIKPIIMGQVLAGMSPDDPAQTAKKDKDGNIHNKNIPMMPIAWIKDYESKSGNKARVFTTTAGTSQAFNHEGTRRMIVNACFWALNMEDQITPKLKVEIVGKYNPTNFGFNTHKKGIKPKHHQN